MSLTVAPTPQTSSPPALALHDRAREIVSSHEAAQERGELFNLLTIIRRGHLEVMTHSPILAELLRPKGSHGHDAKFLRLFLQQTGITDFAPEHATVSEEVGFGHLGRIDLVLKDRLGRKIFIENKIGAGLQDRQLERYQEADKNAPVLYLTLNGDAPAQTDRTKVPNLKLVSYRDDITAWLEACRSASAKHPTVYHVITQYRNLVMKLTRQNLSTKMTHELAAAVLENSETYRAFSALIKAKTEVQHRLADQLSREVRVSSGLNLTRVLNGTGKSYEDAFTQPVTLPGSVKLEAEFSFESAEFQNCYFGFRLREGHLSENQRTLLCRLFTEEFGQTPTTHPTWPAWSFWLPRNWDDEVWARVINGELPVFASEISETLRRLKSVGDRFQQQVISAPSVIVIAP